MKIITKLASAFIKKGKKPFCTAVIVAAGSSNRFAGGDKLFMDLCGMPVLARTLLAFQNSRSINEIVVVTREENIVRVADLCAQYAIEKATKIVCGGDERVDSVFIGVTEASPKAGIIAIHDGARPLVSGDIIKNAVDRAISHKAAAPGIPVNDTIKTVENGVITGTPERAGLVAIQTPQTFAAELIKAALQNVKTKGVKVTDDCSCVELLGAAVHVTQGSFENLKITTESDLIMARSIIDARAEK